MRIASVSIHPVKATAPIDVVRADVTLAGLRHDRRWAVIAPDGTRLNATRHPRLMLVTATPDDAGGLTLSADGRPDLSVVLPTDGVRVPVDVSRVPTMIDAGDPAADWVSVHLGVPARLVWQDDPGRRPISAAHGGLGDEPLNLADTAPILLTTTSSLARLNEWIADDHGPQEVVMRQFRPNLVVEGSDVPFAEDAWRRLRIGDTSYRFAEHCDRCVVTTIDPTTLARGKEPIRTLARHRRWDGSTWFGIRLVPLGTGVVTVGDVVVPD